MFSRWWGMLAEDDRQEFCWLHGGDTILARFVCALDYLIIQKVQAEEANLIQLAYWIANKPWEPETPLDHPSVRSRAVRAWKHDSVTSLMDRIRYRDSRNAANRIQNKLVGLMEGMLEQATALPEMLPDRDGALVSTLKDKRFAADVAVRFLQIVDFTESRMRAERTKRGIEQARKAFQNPDDDLGPKELEAFAKVVAKKLGPEKMKALAAEASGVSE